jgi:hypothetical protein
MHAEEAQTHTPLHAASSTRTTLHASSSTPLVSSLVNKGAGVVVRARAVLREEAASVLARARQWMAAGRAGAADVDGGARGVGGAGAEVGGEAQLERAREDAASVLARGEALRRERGGVSRSEESEERCAHAADTSRASSKDSSSARGRRERGDERHAEVEERGGHHAWAWERSVDNCCSWERELVRRHTN